MPKPKVASVERVPTTPEQKTEAELRRKVAILLLLRKNVYTMDAGSLTVLSPDQRIKLDDFLNRSGWGLEDESLIDFSPENLILMHDYATAAKGSKLEADSIAELKKIL